MLLSFFLLVYPLNRQHIEIDLESSKGSVLRVYWATDNHKFSERNAAFVKTDKGRDTYTLFIDNHTFFTKIRIDPTTKHETPAIIHRMTIRQPGHTILTLAGADLNTLRPVKDIAEYVIKDNSLFLISSGSDPQLLYKHTPHPAIGIHAYSLKIQRIFYNGLLALVGAVAICLTLILWKRCMRFSENKYHEQCIGTLPTFLPDGHPGQLATQRHHHAITALFIVVFGALIYQFYSHFYLPNIFGTQHSPYSDALLWFRGTLHFLDGLDFKTYRPTINLFFGSIYSVFNQVWHIPLFALFYFFLFILIFFTASTIDYRMLISLFCGYLIFFFQQLIVPLNIAQLMVDFLPFSMTFSAAILIGIGLKEDENISNALVLAGLFLLGIAVAIRGVQLVGGMIVLGLVLTVFLARSRWLPALLAIVIYFLPLIADVLLQKHCGAENNGIFSLFCFYHESAHTYTKKGKYLLRALGLPNSEVTGTYLRYVFSPLGFPIFLNYLQDINDSAMKIVLHSYTYLLLGASLILATLHDWISNQRFHIERSTVVKSIIHFIFIPLLYHQLPAYTASILFLYSIALMCVTFFMRQYITSILLAIYIGSTILFAMMGMPGTIRVAGGFMFCLPFAWIALFIEPNIYARTQFLLHKKPLLTYALLVPLFLYSGNMLLPAGPVTQLTPKTVIKISDDPAIDRSLYYADDGRIFYTHRSQESTGTISPYSKITCTGGSFNGSYSTPCTIDTIVISTHNLQTNSQQN